MKKILLLFVLFVSLSVGSFATNGTVNRTQNKVILNNDGTQSVAKDSDGWKVVKYYEEDEKGNLTLIRITITQ